MLTCHLKNNQPKLYILKPISQLLILFGNLLFAQNPGVGVNTLSPHPSAILELNAQDPTTNAKKGLLPPRINLLNSIDTQTIPTPQTGLLVYNLVNAGTYPNEVVANNYYYWNGEKWEQLVYKSVVQEAVKPRIFYIESSVRQDFSKADMNGATADSEPKDQVVRFETPLINLKNIIEFNAVNSTFKVNTSGIYEFSAFVNYNPMAKVVNAATDPSFNNRAFLNLKIQKSTNNGVSWVNTVGTRTAWGTGGSMSLKTAMLLPTPLKLNKGEMVRVVIANPFKPSGSNDHCGAGGCYISNDLTNNIPTAKGLQIQLLDYNIQ